MLADCDPMFAHFTPPLHEPGAGAPRALEGLRAAVKDNYDIAGHPTGNGCPEWAGTHDPARATGSLVARFLAAGVRLTGKAQMDELAYSLMGINARYGTPVNPAAPDRVPGGSSSGSAALVANGSVEIGIGSDTGGSVRIPASFTGVIGLRPTHGSLPMEGLLPFAPSYDTPGFFTRDLRLMARVLAVASGETEPQAPLTRFRAPSDVWAVAEPATAEALRARLPEMEMDTAPLFASGDLLDWFEAFRIHQAFEVWKTLGEWVSATKPEFGPGIAERFEMAAAITPEQFEAAQATRTGIVALLSQAIDEQTCLILPTAPGPAPLRAADPTSLDGFRTRAISLLCIAGHGGLPQLSLPGATVEGAPVGLSLLGARNNDSALIATALKRFGA